MSDDSVLVLRPSAVLCLWVAADVIQALEERDVSRGGVWSASVGRWERYDRPWNGQDGARGTSQLLGTVAAVYGTPTRYDLTLYRVIITPYGAAAGWTFEQLADDALQYGGLTLCDCPRTQLAAPPAPLRLPGLELLPEPSPVA